MVAVGDQVLLVVGGSDVFTVVELIDDSQALVQSAEVYSGEDDEDAKRRWEVGRYPFPATLARLIPVEQT